MKNLELLAIKVANLDLNDQLEKKVQAILSGLDPRDIATVLVRAAAIARDRAAAMTLHHQNKVIPYAAIARLVDHIMKSEVAIGPIHILNSACEVQEWLDANLMTVWSQETLAALEEAGKHDAA